MGAVKFQGMIELDGTAKPLAVSIGEPANAPGDEDNYYCEVEIAPRFEGPKRIFGADAQQARELARSFVLRILSDHVVRNTDGREVQLTLESLQ